MEFSSIAGKLNYHLKILGDLVEKNSQEQYRSTQRGHLAVQLLVSFSKKSGDGTVSVAVQQTKLKINGLLIVAVIFGVTGAVSTIFGALLLPSSLAFH